MLFIDDEKLQYTLLDNNAIIGVRVPLSSEPRDDVADPEWVAFFRRRAWGIFSFKAEFELPNRKFML